MKKQLNFSFTFFLFIGIISSCTLEKRLYRSGYYIECRKNKGTTSPELAIPDYSTNEKTKKSTDSEITEIDLNNVVSSSEVEHYNIISSDRQAEKYVCPSEIKSIHNNFSLIENGLGNKQEIITVSDILTKNVVKNIESTFQKKDDDTDRGKGIYMMLIALALFGLGYLFYSLLGTIGLVFFWIFGIGAGIFFLLGLLYVIFG
jgi:hypothetical protein